MIANTKAITNTDVTSKQARFQRLLNWHSTQPANNDLFRRAKHQMFVFTHAASRIFSGKPQAERISPARPALYPV